MILRAPGWGLFLLLTAVGVLAEPSPVSVLSFNLNNYAPDTPTQRKSPDSYAAVASIIGKASADIVVVQEIRGQEAAEHLRAAVAENGAEYPFLTVVEASDMFRKLAVFSRIKPSKIAHNTTASYTIKDEIVPVRRGFAYCQFQLGDYSFHLIAAHLKSPVYHRLGQTDMRRYEARQLRYFIDEILKENLEANILVVGDLNDNIDSSPLKTILYRRYKFNKRLYDIRPVDTQNTSWTYYYGTTDNYGRVDFALASFGMLPEFIMDRCELRSDSIWNLASDHRAVVVTFMPVEQVNERILEAFHKEVRITDHQRARPADGRVIGSRKVQRE
ncbi:MAG: endonuclease/exonuclease/phosphatase family metal-dependent hydrolase [Rhodothermales bacterium]|jgi:endonuclease/exonuclease/phosphatase family metal-dependent hydrolase